MLEKIGLPPKPSLRGNNWVVDGSNCQGCASQFTFLNRKHHCRRCGGLFCNSCTQERMVLRGQGDSPVRICEPCKKLEEAARFEMRQGRRAGRGSLKSTPRHEDDVLNEVLRHNESLTGNQRQVSIASSSSSKGVTNHDDGDIQDGKPNDLRIDLGSTSPDELRQQSLEEKKKYKILKADGKSEEALRAFKRGKELERQADALEIQLRKNRKKSLLSGNSSDMQNKDLSVDRKTKSLPRTGKGKDDFTAELRELGWSDMDLPDVEKKSANLSLEGELSSIIGEVSPTTGEVKGSRTDRTQVVALKKKALMLKREGKLAEAKEELKRAKILEKQLEEQELLAEAEGSDDELSALIRDMDSDKEEFPNLDDTGHGFDFDNLLRISEDIADGNFEVTDDDMVDPEIACALQSLGWNEDSNHPENTMSESQPLDRDALLSDIQSLKREALNKKRAGNAAEAMAFLKKAKLLERDLNSSESHESNTMIQKSTASRMGLNSQISGNLSDSIQLDERNSNTINNAASAVAPKSRLVIQRELLNLKKKALSLRREGKLTEAEEELRKGAALEQQLEEMDKVSNVKAPRTNAGGNVPNSANSPPDILKDLSLEQGGDDITDQDMSDPTYLSLLRDLGWNDNDNEVSNSSTKPSKKSGNGNDSVVINEASQSQHSTDFLVGAPRRSKFEIQRELLGLKRKALALRREGKIEDAEELLKKAKELEANMAEVEAPKKEARIEENRMKDKFLSPPVESAVEERSDEVVTEEDMHDPVLNSLLLNLGWKEEDSVTVKEKLVDEATGHSSHSVDKSVLGSSSGIPSTVSRSKGEIQRELLVLKRKALALRRKGETKEADEILMMAKKLEAQMEDPGTLNKDIEKNASNDEKSTISDFHEKQRNHGVAAEADRGSTLSEVGTSENTDKLSAGLERINNRTNIPLLSKSDHVIPRTSQLTVSVELSAPDENLSKAGPPIPLDSFTTLNQDDGHINNVTTQKRVELKDADEKPSIREPNTVPGSASQHHNSIQQEILAHKRKAVTLKREGKLAEAREELWQAKLLEKSLEDGNLQPHNVTANNISSDTTHVQKTQDSSPPIAAKSLSSRDRLKLQQESLGHKRQALKLRREGRMEEAEAEFEQAKALEKQLEELTAQDSNKASVSMSDTVDDVGVEDFLDPQLLSALKAAGIGDVSVVSKGPDMQEPAKPNVAKIENSNQERIQLEERIKAEKLKALHLKRSGKQAEALDALRRAKMYEKKLSSISSG
ncbi:hypothetical protein L6164_005548 [Bauhinia variegata]|uniref:Uncharacterized protein n=1 Tax=Bauhinia variegata TaxID=167791 RepID=A0ACB9PRM5_BAUVA|nr:hypothetical protein L6164_005548 [Bauhinia variegata]